MRTPDTLREIMAEIEAHATQWEGERIDPSIPPDPDPEPPVPVPPGGFGITENRAIDVSRLVAAEQWHETGSQYTRHQLAVVVSGVWDCVVRGLNFAGIRDRIPDGDITLEVGPISITQTFDEPTEIFSIDTTLLPEGENKIVISSSDPTEDCIPLTIIVHNTLEHPTDIQRQMTACNGSYDLRFEGPRYQEAVVPPQWDPEIHPLTPRVWHDQPEAIEGWQNYHRSMFVPWELGNLRYTNELKSGWRTTKNRQAYHRSTIDKKHPRVAMLSGPRGVARIGGATCIRPGNTGSVWVSDAWRFMHINSEGLVETLAGYDDTIAHYHRDTPPFPNRTLKGDWSAVTGELGFHTIWGWDTDKSSIVRDDDNVPPLPNGKIPHPGNPTFGVCDTLNNRVLKLTHDGAVCSPLLPESVVTEIAINLDDPWGIAYHAGYWYVGERGMDRILKIDAMGVIETFLEPSKDLTYISSKREAIVYSHLSLDEARAEPVCAPEGMYVIDDWLYYASFAIKQVRRINLLTREIETVLPELFLDGNSSYCQLGVSDGSFLPKGTMLVSDWSTRQHGWPRIYLPDGELLDMNTFNSAKVPSGVAMSPNYGYSASAGIAFGRMAFSGSTNGIAVISGREPGDVEVDHDKYKAGEASWKQKSYHYAFGQNGFGSYGLPLPALTEEEQYFVDVNRG